MGAGCWEKLTSLEASNVPPCPQDLGVGRGAGEGVQSPMANVFIHPNVMKPPLNPQRTGLRVLRFRELLGWWVWRCWGGGGMAPGGEGGLRSSSPSRTPCPVPPPSYPAVPKLHPVITQRSIDRVPSRSVSKLTQPEEGVGNLQPAASRAGGAGDNLARGWLLKRGQSFRTEPCPAGI